jgi:hypothetical protein
MFRSIYIITKNAETVKELSFGIFDLFKNILKSFKFENQKGHSKRRARESEPAVRKGASASFFGSGELPEEFC